MDQSYFILTLMAMINFTYIHFDSEVYQAS